MKTLGYIIAGLLTVALATAVTIYLSLSKEVQQMLFPEKGMYDPSLLTEVAPGRYKVDEFRFKYFGGYLVYGLVENPDAFLVGDEKIEKLSSIKICIKETHTSLSCDYSIRGRFERYKSSDEHSYSVAYVRVCEEEGCVAQGSVLDYVAIDSPVTFREVHIKKISDL